MGEAQCLRDIRYIGWLEIIIVGLQAMPDVSSPQGRFSEALKFHRLSFSAGLCARKILYEFDADTTIRRFTSRAVWPIPNSRSERLPHQTCVYDRRLLTECLISGPTYGNFDENQVQQVRSRLGPDPLLSEFTAQDCIQPFERRSASIAAILMDQSAIAGIGNIYRSELLFHHRIDGHTREDTLSRHDPDLWRTSVDWLTLSQS